MTTSSNLRQKNALLKRERNGCASQFRKEVAFGRKVTGINDSSEFSSVFLVDLKIKLLLVVYGYSIKKNCSCLTQVTVYLCLAFEFGERVAR